MNKFLQLMMCFGLVTGLNAQIVSSDLAGVGSSYDYKEVTTVSDSDLENMSMALFNSDPSGNTWDFSTLTPDVAEYFSATVVNPASAPGFASMTGANYCLLETFSTYDRYSFFNVSTTEYARVGSYRTDAMFANTFSDTQVELVFPMEPGVVNEDDWQSATNVFPGFCNIEGIATGTLIVPGGTTYNNVTLMKIRAGVILPVDFYYFLGYDGIPRMVYTPEVTELGLNRLWRYVYDSTVGVDELSSNDINVQYNNPINDAFNLVFTLDTDTDFHVTVFNINGSAIHEEEIRVTSGYHNTQIDANQWSEGLYLVRITDLNNRVEKTLKVVKR